MDLFSYKDFSSFHKDDEYFRPPGFMDEMTYLEGVRMSSDDNKSLDQSEYVYDPFDLVVSDIKTIDQDGGFDKPDTYDDTTLSIVDLNQYDTDKVDPDDLSRQSSELTISTSKTDDDNSFTSDVIDTNKYFDIIGNSMSAQLLKLYHS